jgi:hypothetical protein
VIDWETIQEGLQELVESLSGAPAQMQDEPRDYVDPDVRAVALLSVFSIGALSSRPDKDYEDGEGLGYAEAPFGDLWGGSSPNLIEWVSEVEEIVLRVLLESYSQHPSDVARAYLERLRARLCWTSSLQTIKGLGLSYQSTDQVTEVSTTYDDHVISAAVLDVRFTVRNNETDTANPHARIETVETQHVT